MVRGAGPKPKKMKTPGASALAASSSAKTKSSAKLHRVGSRAAASPTKKKSGVTLFSKLLSENVAVLDSSHVAGAWGDGLRAVLKALGPNVLFPAAGASGDVALPEVNLGAIPLEIDAQFHAQIQLLLKEAVEARGGFGKIRTQSAHMLHNCVTIRPGNGYVTYDGKSVFKSLVPTSAKLSRGSIVFRPDTLTCEGMVNLGKEPLVVHLCPRSGFGFKAGAKAAGGKDQDLSRFKRSLKAYTVLPGHSIVWDASCVRGVKSGKLAKTAPAASDLKDQIENAVLYKNIAFHVTVSEKDTILVEKTKQGTWSERLAQGKPPLMPNDKELSLFPATWYGRYKERLVKFREQFAGTGLSAGVLADHASKQARFPHYRQGPDFPADKRYVYEDSAVTVSKDDSGAGAGADSDSDSGSGSASSSDSKDESMSDAPIPASYRRARAKQKKRARPTRPLGKRRNFISDKSEDSEDSDDSSAYSEEDSDEDEDEDEGRV